MGVTKSIFFLPIVAAPIDRAHYTALLMRITGLVEIVNITGRSLCRRLQMLGARGVCALESSSIIGCFSQCVEKLVNYTSRVRAATKGLREYRLK